MTVLETLTTKDGKYRLEVEPDNEAEAELVDLGTKIYAKGFFDNNLSSFDDGILAELFDGDEDKYDEMVEQNHDFAELFDALNKRFNSKGIYLSLISKYEHTQVQFYATAPNEGWDDSVIGYAIYNPKKAKKYYSKGETSEWSNYDEWHQSLKDYLDDASKAYNGEAKYLILYNNKNDEELGSNGCIFLDDNKPEDKQLVDIACDIGSDNIKGFPSEEYSNVKKWNVDDPYSY